MAAQPVFSPVVITRTAASIQRPAAQRVIPSASSNIVPGITNEDVFSTLGTLIGTAVGGPAGATLGGALGGALDRRLAGPDDCPTGFVRNQFGVCEFVGSPGDISTGGQTPGTSMVAASGIAPGGGALPTPMQITRLRCPQGTVLGKDNRCYRSLPKRDRKWNPGRKPLLTGGEMNAIAKAARAAKKLKSAEKRLAKAGRTLAPRKSTSRRPSRTVRGPTPTHSLTVIDTE